MIMITIMISNGDWTKWSTIQGVIGHVISNDLKLRAQLPLNCMTQSPITY